MRASLWLSPLRALSLPSRSLQSVMVRFASLFGLAAAAAAASGATVTPANLLGEIIDALGIGLVTSINATITLDTLTTNQLSITFAAQNPLIFELTIDRVNSTAGINGTVYATFDHTFPSSSPVVVPALGTAVSGVVPNVTLTQGALNSLDIIALGYLDLIEVNVWVRALTINGKLGIPLTISGLHQQNVTTTYTLAL